MILDGIISTRLNEGYSMHASKEMNVVFIKNSAQGMETRFPYNDDENKEIIQIIEKHCPAIEDLEAEEYLKIDKEGYTITSAICKDVTSGPYCETRGVEVLDSATGYCVRESLSNLNTTLKKGSFGIVRDRKKA